VVFFSGANFGYLRKISGENALSFAVGSIAAAATGVGATA
jgi:hypothetical protein